MIRSQAVPAAWGGTWRRRQGGAVAVEFAFVFPLLFGLVYATIVYGYVFFAQQTVNLIAQECAKAAVAASLVDASGKPVTSARAAYSQAALYYFTESQNQGLASIWKTQLTLNPPPNLAPTADGNGQVFTVTVTYTGPQSIFPTINLGWGDLPPVPKSLVASASVRVS